jgi:hypothetical protein
MPAATSSPPMDTTQDQFKIILVIETFSTLFGTRSFRPDDLEISGGNRKTIADAMLTCKMNPLIKSFLTAFLLRFWHEPSQQTQRD